MINQQHASTAIDYDVVNHKEEERQGLLDGNNATPNPSCRTILRLGAKRAAASKRRTSKMTTGMQPRDDAQTQTKETNGIWRGEHPLSSSPAAKRRTTTTTTGKTTTAGRTIAARSRAAVPYEIDANPKSLTLTNVSDISWQSLGEPSEDYDDDDDILFWTTLQLQQPQRLGIAEGNRRHGWV